MTRPKLVILPLMILLTASGGAQTAPTPEQRAEVLLKQMTIEEKAMQLSTVFPVGLFGADGPLQSELDGQLEHGIGHVAAMGLIGHKTPEQMAKLVNAVQRYLVTQTRLKIPAIFHNEAMSGVVAPHFTQFPTSIGLAATWNPAATQEMAVLIRRQMRAVGQLQALSPVLDVARDARWGRVSETYGEDPYLVSAIGVAYTRGLQGNDLSKGVLATAKHFVGYGVTEGGQNMAATAIGARELYDVYARPFEAAFRLAGLASVMPSYSEFDGVPVSASKAVLTDLLRTRMGFTGTTVSDYVAVNFLHTRQKVAASAEEAGLLALAAGMAYALGSVIDKLPAVITDYYGGPHQATALADAIFGVTNPGGKLPFTIPRHVGQVPIHLGQKWGSGYRRTKEDIHKGYLDMPSTPLYSFGHGLSYTSFQYSPISLSSDSVDASGDARITLSATNTGKRRGTEVVQLYAADTATGVTLPAQQLVGFTRVDLEPGASKTVTFVLPLSVLAYTGLTGELVMEPGPIELSVGSSADDIRSKAMLTVTGNTRTIRAEERKFLSVATVGS